MDRYCGPCRNGARCEQHPERDEQERDEQRRSDKGGPRIVVAVAVLFVLLVVVPLVWEYVELARSEP